MPLVMDVAVVQVVHRKPNTLTLTIDPMMSMSKRAQVAGGSGLIFAAQQLC